MDDCDFIGPTLYPVALLIVIVLGVTGGIGFWLGTQANPQYKAFREVQADIRRCEASLPRDQYCKLDLSEALIVVKRKGIVRRFLDRD